MGGQPPSRPSTYEVCRIPGDPSPIPLHLLYRRPLGVQFAEWPQCWVFCRVQMEAAVVYWMDRAFQQSWHPLDWKAPSPTSLSLIYQFLAWTRKSSSRLAALGGLRQNWRQLEIWGKLHPPKPLPSFYAAALNQIQMERIVIVVGYSAVCRSYPSNPSVQHK